MLPGKIRRKFAGFIAGLAAAVAFAPFEASAQAYPNRPITFICAFPAGVGSDPIVRYLANAVQTVSGNRVLVENKPGAGGVIAAEHVVRSKPDGHTVLVHAPVVISNVTAMFAKPPFDPRQSVEIASTFLDGLAFFIAVDSKSSYSSLADLTADLRRLGDKAVYGSVAVSSKIVGEAYKASMGLNAAELAYKSPPDSINDLLSGSVQFAALDPVLGFMESRKGRVRLLATSAGKRLQMLPEVPTLKEAGVNIDLTGWFAAMVPMGTDPAAKAKLDEWIQKAISTPDAAKVIGVIGAVPYLAKPEEGQKRMIAEIDDWVEYARIAKLTPQ